MPSMTTVKLLGLVGAASYVLARLAVYVRFVAWHRAHVIAVPRSGLPTMPRGFAVRAMEPDALTRYAIDVTAPQQAERFAQGFSCLGAFNARGALTGVIWVTAKGCTENDVSLWSRPPVGAAWDTGMWIHPDHRMARTFQALWAGVGAWLDARALTASYSTIVDYNLHSMNAHGRLGLVRLCRIKALRLGRWQLIKIGQGGWRFAHPLRPIDWAVPTASFPAEQRRLGRAHGRAVPA